MIKFENNNYPLYKRMIFVIVVAIILFFTMLIQLISLQIIKYNHYNKLSDKNRIQIFLKKDIRGNITDNTNKPLVYNETLYNISLKNTKKNKNFVKSFYFNKKNDRIIIKHLNWQDMSKIKSNNLFLDDLKIKKITLRKYKNSDSISNITGYIKNKLNQSNGINGIENYYDNDLKGQFGKKEYEVTANGNKVRKISETKPTKGQDIHLTINLKLQTFAHNLLKKYKSGSIVVLNIQTNEILALVSHPSFDANILSKDKIDYNYWKKINDNSIMTMLNKPIKAKYPPASLFKIVIALCALENNIITPDKEIYCNGAFLFKGHKYHCVKKQGHKHMNMTNAIVQSCDVYFYVLAQKIGFEKILKTMNDLNLNDTFDIHQSKIISTDQYNLSNWAIYDTILSGIGQGKIILKPLNLAFMISKIINPNNSYVPNIVKNSNNKLKIEQPNLKQKNLNYIINTMNLAVNSPKGLVYQNRINEPGYEMGGKTGTAQIISNKLYKKIKEQSKNMWQYNDHGLFAGFAPVHSPKYAICVFIDHGGWGSKSAAPIAKKVLHFCQKNII